jgi:hypothetical protein
MTGSCLLETVLLTNEFRSVDEPMHSAVDLFTHVFGSDPIVPCYVRAAFEAAKASQEVAPKRATWLVLAVILPQIPAYIMSTSSKPEKASAFFRWLESEVERLFHGAYGEFDSPLCEFVVASQIYYNSLP